MRGLPGDLNKRLQSALRLCEVFDSDRGLRAVFLDTRLSPWRDQLPQAVSRTERVLVAVDFLYARSSTQGQNALVLLLQVLRDLTDPDDALHGQLGDLAMEVGEWASRTGRGERKASQGAWREMDPHSEPTPRNTQFSTRLPFEPELVLIPAGEFLIGSDPKEDETIYDDEQPQHIVYLPDYFIAKTPVTNAQYAAFVQAAGYTTPRHWQYGKIPAGKDTYPVVYVSWHDAMAYCRWLTEVTGKPYSLPSEAEWEKAARGTDGRLYPWGDFFDKSRCNSLESGIGYTTPVDRYPQGASLYGVLDMVGNVWEWTLTCWVDTYKDYDNKALNGLGRGCSLRVLRGGAFVDLARDVRCACRLSRTPSDCGTHVGFRVVAVAGDGVPIDSVL